MLDLEALLPISWKHPYTMSSRKPYTGPHRRLIVGIDVGTTYSGVSYSILEPSLVPTIQGVNRYPAQERVGGDAKIPSIIYYDSVGTVRTVGAEATLETNIELARDEQWNKAEWFKLYLRPTAEKERTDDYLPPLPFNKTAEQVLGDFLRYLYACTREYIQDTHAGGPGLWRSLQGHAEFILTHPNGWGGAQQALMRRAAIHAGLVPDTPDGHSRVKFVTEGEASLHYCINNNFALEIIKSGEGVIIVDAGGGTIDLSAFYFKHTHTSNEFEEIAAATCHFQGSLYITRRAKAFLQKKLQKSRYDTPDDIDHITDCFDKTTKLSFKDPNQPALIKFGSARDADPSVDVKYGQLKLQGVDVASFFDPTVAAIQKAIDEQRAAALIPVTSVLLVGGFAASSPLFSSLRDYLQKKELRLCRPDGHLGKVVADGAVSFLLDHFVTVRIAHTTLGIPLYQLYDRHDPEHDRRFRQAIISGDGKLYIPGAYEVIIAKGTRVSEKAVFKRSLRHYVTDKLSHGIKTLNILAYKGSNPDPRWIDIEPELYSEVGVVTADVRSAVRTLPYLTGPKGERYICFDYKIELHFGLTEHKAQICWEENGKEKRGPATIVYDWAAGKE